MGSDLPDPCGRFLPNLLTLLDVSARSCTKEVFKGIPNLKKLGIRIELSLDVVEPLCCFDHLVHLNELESLKCVVVNPNTRSPVVSPPAPISIFPSGLKKLNLSGFGYPWEYINTIAKLGNLQVRDYAFRGSKWEANEGDFSGLKYLLIEDTDLEYWGGGFDCFSSLERLIIRNCYKLKELPQATATNLKIIELVDCNPLFVAFVKQIEKNGRCHRYEPLEVSVHFSADDEKSKA
ncbi:hypothetical protein BUALT_Bualt07G0069100 [Buddleja alternifolia]|uniref:Uncharacterized protein n=1 Tax=Buddleja alternifolia TaxID=168488 RepID=A0AAV6XD79_9LAMI|nr:hypothetical protein BUALT_Bualt07G0069100 [Buddleja alternifolia]